MAVFRGQRKFNGSWQLGKCSGNVSRGKGRNGSVLAFHPHWGNGCPSPPCAILPAMNLSFPPADLHLTQTDDDTYVLRLGTRVFLSTKSKRAAIGKYNALRLEFEKAHPPHEPTAREKAELLAEHIAEHGTPRPVTQISPKAIVELEAALRIYCTAVQDSDLAQSSQATYITHADSFVRWLRGEFQPGSRVMPYRPMKRAS